MPDIAGPFDGSAGQWGQAQWYRDAYARTETGVYGLPVSSVGAGDLALTLNGLGWSVGLGRAHVRGAGYERTTSPSTGTVPANTSGTARIDRLVLRRDLASKTVTVVRIQGTPAASPLIPGLSIVEDGVWDTPLFRFTVPANSGTTLTGVTDERRWIGDGVSIPYEVVTPGSGWYQYGAGLQALTVSRCRGLITVSGTLGNTNTYSGPQTVATLPPAYRPLNGNVPGILSLNGVQFGRADALPTGNIDINPNNTIGANTFHAFNFSWVLG